MIPWLKSNKNGLFFAVSFIIVGLVALLPLFFEGIYDGSDSAYHLTRIKSVAEGIKAGDFPVKIHPEPFDGYGYGNGLFYPNFFLFIPALLMVLGVSFEISYKIFLTLILFGVFSTSYLTAKHIFKNSTSAFLTSILYGTSQAFLTNMYELITLGEALAMVFIPLVILALYNVVYEDFSKPQWLIIAFLSMILAHTITLFLSGLIAIGFLACNFKKLFRNPERPRHGRRVVGKVALCAAMVLALSVGYWLPMIEQLLTAEFRVTHPWTWVSHNAVDIPSLFWTHRPGVGLVPLLSALGLILNRKTPKGMARNFIITGLVLALITTKLVPWKIFDATFVNAIQFPRRFMPYAAMFMSLGVGGCVTSFMPRKTLAKYSLTAVLLGTLLLLNHSLIAVHAIVPINYDIAQDQWANGCCEWLPEGTDESILDHQGIVRAASGEELPLLEKEGTSVTFNLPEDLKESEYFELPLIYYKGYTAQITDENGETVTLRSTSGENNVVRIHGEGLSGSVSVSYEGTSVQKIAYIANAVAVVALTVISTWLISKKKKQRKAISLG